METVDLDRLDEVVRRAMQEPVLTSEEQMERRVDSIIRELDELCAFAANKETVDLVEAQRVAVGQMKTRVDLIASFLLANTHKPGLRVVRNNG